MDISEFRKELDRFPQDALVEVMGYYRDHYGTEEAWHSMYIKFEYSKVDQILRIEGDI
jgi:hypothetical protein